MNVRDVRRDDVIDAARHVVDVWGRVECGCDAKDPQCSVCVLALCLRVLDGEDA